MKKLIFASLLLALNVNAQPVSNVREETTGTNYCDMVSGEYGNVPASHRSSNLNYFFQCSLGRSSPYPEKNCPRGIQQLQIPSGLTIGSEFVDEYRWTTYRNVSQRAFLTRVRQQACQLLVQCYNHRNTLHPACPNDWQESIPNYRVAFCARYRSKGTCHIPQGFMENAFYYLNGGSSSSPDAGTDAASD